MPPQADNCKDSEHPIHTGTKAGEADDSVYQGLLLDSSKNCAAEPSFSISGRGRLLTGGSYGASLPCSLDVLGNLCQR